MSRAATEARTRATKEWISLHVKAERGYRPPGGKDLQRRQLRRTRKPLAERHYQPLSGYVTIGSFLHGQLGSTGQECCWVQQRGKTVPPSPLCLVPGMGSPDQKAVEEGGQSLRVETPKGLGGESTMEEGSS